MELNTITKNISLAFALAQETYKKGNYPIGSVLLINNSITIFGENKVVTNKNQKYHSEIDIIIKANKYKQTIDKKILFVTLEPCINCSMALKDFGIEEVYYILEDAFHGGSEYLKKNHIQTYKVNILEKEYLEIMVDFLNTSGKYSYVLSYYTNRLKEWKN